MKVTVYTMDYCGFCEAAKSLLKQRGIPFQEIHVDTADDQAWDDLFKRTGMRTMPQIFYRDDQGVDKLVGGYRELAELDRRDGLQSLRYSSPV